MKDDKALLLDFAVEQFGSPGLVMDPALARKSPCRCYTYKKKPTVCFSEGIIGVLKKAQIKEFCPKIIDAGPSKRVEAFIEASDKASKSKSLRPWLKKMGKELKKKGIDI